MEQLASVYIKLHDRKMPNQKAKVQLKSEGSPVFALRDILSRATLTLLVN